MNFPHFLSLTQALGHCQQVLVVQALLLHPLVKMVLSEVGAEIAMGPLVETPMVVDQQLQITFPLHGIRLLQ